MTGSGIRKVAEGDCDRVKRGYRQRAGLKRRIR